MEILKGQQVCACGKRHDGILDEYVVAKGATGRTAEFVKKYGAKKAFLLADTNTFAVAGTRDAIHIYEQLKNIVPNREKALAYACSFDIPAHQEKLRAFLGKGAESMIAIAEKESKYDPAKHVRRLDAILARWDEILQIMDEELLSAPELEKILDTLGAPKTAAEIGIDEAIVPMTFRMTKNIRDKYVLSCLCWDLGVLDEIQP